MRIIVFAFIFLVIACKRNDDPPPEPVMPVPTQTQLDWQEKELFAFVHFTINTFTDMEWGYGDEHPDQFQPENYDPDPRGAVDPEGHWNEEDFEKTLESFQGPAPYTLRSIKCRYTYYPGYEFGELFDLGNDPNEFDNLWNQPEYQEIKLSLKEELL